MLVFGLSVLLALTLSAVLAPSIAPFDPAAQHPGEELHPPGPVFFFGSDEFGRDILSRVVFGSRVSLLVGIVAVSLGAVTGVPLGILAGFYGGWTDTVIMRCGDALLALPGILLAIAVLAILGPGTMQTALALAIVSVPEFARLMRSSVLVERERDYALAAISVGTTSERLIIRHLIPNSMGPVLVQLSLAMSFAVLSEAALSFLGMGTGPPTPSWGGMLQEKPAVPAPGAVVRRLSRGRARDSAPRPELSVGRVARRAGPAFAARLKASGSKSSLPLPHAGWQLAKKSVMSPTRRCASCDKSGSSTWACRPKRRLSRPGAAPSFHHPKRSRPARSPHPGTARSFAACVTAWSASGW